jgi:precorrin-3B synthase
VEIVVHAEVSPAATARRDPGVGDACPGVLRVHEAADGHLARVRVPGGRLNARALHALAAAARLGNDIVELTSRAGVQIRGLGPDMGEHLAGVLASGGLLPWPAHERVRNIVAAPLAGRDPASVAAVDEIVAALDGALCADAALVALPGRFLFAVDDGTSALDGLRADVGVVAERGAAGAVFRLCLDGMATSMAVAPGHAHEAALAAARAFLELRARDGDGAWRVRELPGGAERLAEHVGASIVERPPTAPRSGPRRPGVRVQRDGRFALSALPPLARLNGAQLERLAELAGDVRVSPWRTLTFVDVDARAVAGLLVELERIGLVTASDSGWVGLSACAGLGACARARLDVRERAARRASERDERSPTEHWSACERRCGEPPDVGVSAVAGEHGVELTMAGAPA